MKKELSLRKRADIRRVLKDGRRIATKHFALYMCENDIAETRLAIALSKIHCKRATRRNRLRRIGKEAFRNASAKIANGQDFLIASKKRFDTSDFKIVAQELREIVLRMEK